MTWLLNISGHDDLTGDEKEAYEQDIVAKAAAFVGELAAKEGGRVAVALATTNTTGTIYLLERPG